MTKLNKTPIILSIIILLLAIPSGWPYGFYTFLRFLVCGTSVYVVIFSHENKRKFWFWVFITIAVLFNPLIPIHLSKDIWVVLDLLIAIVLGSSLFLLKNKPNPVC